MPDSPSGWLRSLAAEATPGPWTISDSEIIAVVVNDDPTDHVAIMGNGAPDESDEALADASLIALAPDLAVLCADAIDALEALGNRSGDCPGCDGATHGRYCPIVLLLARFAALQPDNTEEGT